MIQTNRRLGFWVAGGRGVEGIPTGGEARVRELALALRRGTRHPFRLGVQVVWLKGVKTRDANILRQ